MSKTVAIAGGGLAGLASAVFLADKGFRVKLFESSPKFGGRAYSFFDKERNMFFDNGQHLLAGWYENAFRYLKLIGTYDLLDHQDRLEIDYAETGGKSLRLAASSQKPLQGLLAGLLKFKGFSLAEKMKLFRINQLLQLKVPGEFENAEQLLRAFGQSGNLIKYFWEPFILAVFNAHAADTSPKLLLNVLRDAMNCEKGFTLVIPSCDLNMLFIDPALEFLNERNCTVERSAGIKGCICNNGAAVLLNDADEEVDADYVISAVPFYAFDDLFGEVVRADSKKFRTSSIVSVHLFCKDKLNPVSRSTNSLGMTCMVGTKAQWLFRKSDNHISLVISGADRLGVTGMTNDEIVELCVKEINECVSELSTADLEYSKVIREKRATFIPDRTSDIIRPSQRTHLENFFLAGDWTDTGLPSTIEGAIKSAAICATHICE
jgi:squalene-associated FAD-dependent desaturase